jgi:hypothetical protein
MQTVRLSFKLNTKILTYQMKVFDLILPESLEMLRGRQKLQEQSDLENPSEGTRSKLQQHLERSQFNFFFESYF